MDLIGLINNIYESAVAIDAGRKGWAERGIEQKARISYEKGISKALASFKDAQSSIDPEIIILAEYTFINQELEFCSEDEKTTMSSLTQAKESFDDAFLALEIAEDSTLYQGAEKTYPRHKDHRVSGFPRDAFHIACMAHKTRLQNIERSPGIDPIEKALLRQRLVNLATAQNGYVEKQKKALAG